jgi:hypothetical protein
MKRVNPNDARKGQYVDSYPFMKVQEKYIQKVCERLENSLRRNNQPGEIVYTKIPAWGKGGKLDPFDTWQIFWVK